MEIILKAINVLLYISQIWLMSYFVIVVIFVIADILNVRLTKIPAWNKPQEKNYSFAVIVPLHQNIDFLEPILDSLLKQQYRNLHFFVIADDCPVIDLPYQDERIHILYPPAALHSKIKSIQLALSNIDEQKFDAIAIFDADNLVHPEFFTVINSYFNKGYRAVQSNILPKNIDTTFARLDTINDQYYNFIDRLSPARLHLSAHIAGRGTVIDLKMYKSVSYTNFFGGFDKKLQCELAKKYVIGYAPDAKLYDEKVSDGNSMQKQRTRWINAYFRYFSEAWKIFLRGIGTGNFRLAFFGYNNMRPPLFIQFFAAFALFATSFFVLPAMLLPWTVVLTAYLLSFLYIVIFKNSLLSVRQSVKAVMQIPLFVSRQVRALLNIKKANKSFLQTNNYKAVFIDDIMQGNTAK
ncbi:glycosyltransferase [Foetidibacter luteolus]|uniref:glycosyltransferase n=1 Tax=Foetidibacter luteolus TaxID=2608880 RepID=UPI00129B4A32|nr:glycosyltransferase [Foetidibacter luteolus]